MKNPTDHWTRRTFLSTLGLTGAAAFAPALHAAPSRGTRPRPMLAFVGMTREDRTPSSTRSQQIAAFRVQDATWTSLDQPIRAAAPHAIALHPSLPILYAVHRIGQHRHRPTGSVSAFSFDPASGAMQLLSSQSLSLSATHPEHLAVSHDGRSLLISATGGGAYNLFAIDSDGTLLPAPYPLKQIGCGPHPIQNAAHPKSIVFSSSGLTAYSCDLGADRINHIALDNEESQLGSSRLSSRGISLRGSRTLAAGSGPSALAIAPSADFLVAVHHLRPALALYPIDPGTGEVLAPTDHHALDAANAGPLALNASAGLAFVATSDRDGLTTLSSLRITRGHRLTPVQQTPIRLVSQPRHLICLDDHLLLAGCGGVARIPIDPATGRMDAAIQVIDAPHALSLAILQL